MYKFVWPVFFSMRSRGVSLNWTFSSRRQWIISMFSQERWQTVIGYYAKYSDHSHTLLSDDYFTVFVILKRKQITRRLNPMQHKVSCSTSSYGHRSRTAFDTVCQKIEGNDKKVDIQRKFSYCRQRRGPGAPCRAEDLRHSADYGRYRAN